MLESPRYQIFNFDQGVRTLCIESSDFKQLGIKLTQQESWVDSSGQVYIYGITSQETTLDWLDWRSQFESEVHSKSLSQNHQIKARGGSCTNHTATAKQRGDGGFRIGSKSLDSQLNPLRWVRINNWLGQMSGRNLICSVVGCKESSQRFSSEVQKQAFLVGQWVALSGFTLMTGGLSGVMRLAAEGARSVGGQTIGLLPGQKKEEANPFINFVIPTGIGIARNYQMALGCDIMIALNGGRGTLEEVCFALDFEKPVLSMNSWTIDEVQVATNDNEALSFLIENLLHHTDRKTLDKKNMHHSLEAPRDRY